PSDRTMDAAAVAVCQRYGRDRLLDGLPALRSWKNLKIPAEIKLCLRKGFNQGFGEFLCSGFAADVLCGVFAFAVDLFERSFDAAGHGAFAKVIEHHNAAHEQGSRIGESFAGDVRRSAVDGFKHCSFVANVAAGNDAEASDKARGEVAHDIAVKIRQQKHVILFGLQHHLHAGVVNDEFFVFDVRIFLCHGPNGLEEEAVGELHDVCFVDGVNFLAIFAFGVFKCKARDACGSLLRDDFQALDDTRDNFVFETGIEILCVFADQHYVNIIEV